MSALSVFTNPDFWSVITRSIGSSKYWKTYSTYRDTRSAIKYGYFELLKSKRVMDVTGYEFRGALELGSLDIFVRLDSMFRSSLHRVVDHIDCITSMEMLEYFYRKIPAVFDSELLVVVIFLKDKFFIVDFLHKHGVRTTVERILVYVEKQVNISVSLESLDFLRQQYPEALVYKTVSGLEDTPGDDEWFEKHDILQLISQNEEIFPSEEIQLCDTNLNFAKLLYKNSVINNEKIVGDAPTVFRRDRIRMVKWLWRENSFDQKIESNLAFQSTILRIASVSSNRSFEWLVAQADFSQRINIWLGVDVHRMLAYAKKEHIHVSEVLKRIRLLEDNGETPWFRLDLLKYLSGIDGMTTSKILFFLNRISEKERMLHKCWKVRYSDTWFLIVRYSAHQYPGGELKEKHKQNMLESCTNAAITVIESRRRSSYFGLAYIFRNIVAKHITRPPLNDLIDNFEAIVEVDRNRELLTDREIIDVHKQFYPIILEMVKDSTENEYNATCMLCRIMVEQDLDELVEFYEAAPYYDVYYVLFLSEQSKRLSFLDKLILKRPSLKIFLDSQ